MPPPLSLSRLRPSSPALVALLFAAVCLVLLSTSTWDSGEEYSEAGAVASGRLRGALAVQGEWSEGSDGPRMATMGGLARLFDDGDNDEQHQATNNNRKKLRVGLAGAGTGARQRILPTFNSAPDSSLSFTLQHPPPPSLAFHPAHSPTHTAYSALLRARLLSLGEAFVTRLGDVVLALFGLDEDDWADEVGEDGEVRGRQVGGAAGAALASWSESSVYVERTNSLHPSRPSSFGPHLVTDPFRGLLFPISSLSSSSSYGCSLPSPSSSLSPLAPPAGWVALIQRGECPFSDKVRTAQRLGAGAVVFGDMEESEGGIAGGKGLLTPWSPDDTDDISIPSVFVSRASYLSLLRTWEDEQDLARDQPAMEDGGVQTDLRRALGGDGTGEGGEREVAGLEVVLSKEEIFAWPLLDLLFLLLFLPSLLTLVTVFTQRVRTARAAKADRAPREAVARLPVFRWGDAEKPAHGAGAAAGGAAGDEEREVGTPREEADESTSLLSPSTSPPTLLQRLSSRLPPSLSRRLPSRLAPPSSPSPPRALSQPTRKYPTLTECPFCLSDFERGDLVMELPCGHVFHAEEVQGWLEGQKGICPVCRVPIAAAAAAASSTPPAAAALPVPAPLPLPLAEGAAVLVHPLHTAPFATSAAAAPEQRVRRDYAASPVASSSSVPIEGLMVGAAPAPAEEAKADEEAK